MDWVENCLEAFSTHSFYEPDDVKNLFRSFKKGRNIDGWGNYCIFDGFFVAEASDYFKTHNAFTPNSDIFTYSEELQLYLTSQTGMGLKDRLLGRVRAKISPNERLDVLGVQRTRDYDLTSLDEHFLINAPWKEALITALETVAFTRAKANTIRLSKNLGEIAGKLNYKYEVNSKLWVKTAE